MSDEEIDYELYQGADIEIDSITEGGLVPLGKYECRLENAVFKMSKGQPDGSGKKPMLEVTHEIVSGDHEGDSIKQWHLLTVTVDKKTKKRRARGVVDIKHAIAAVGDPLPAGFRFPLDRKIEKLYSAKLGKGKKYVVLVTEVDNYKDPTKKDRNVRVLGLVAPTKAAAAPAESEPTPEVPDDDDEDYS